MGDPATPTNPGDKLGVSAPKDLKDFLSCKTDAVTLKDGRITWLPSAVELSITPDDSNPNAATLQIGFGGFGPSLPAQVTDGQLSIDTSGLVAMADLVGKVFEGADKLPGQIDAFVKNTNAWFKANGKQLGPPTVAKGSVGLKKVPIAPSATQPQKPAAPPIVAPVDPPKPAPAPVPAPAAPPESPGPAVIHVGDHDIQVEPPVLPLATPDKPAPPPVPKADVTPMAFDGSGMAGGEGGASAGAPAMAGPGGASSAAQYRSMTTDQLRAALAGIRDARRGGEDELHVTAWDGLATPPNEDLDRRELEIKRILDQRGVDAWDGPSTGGVTPAGPPASSDVATARPRNIWPVAAVGVGAVGLIAGVLLFFNQQGSTLTAAGGSQGPAATTAQSSATAPSEGPAETVAAPAWTPWPAFNLPAAQQVVDASAPYKVTVNITEQSLEAGGSTDLSRSFTIDATQSMKTILDRGVTFVDSGTTVTRNGTPITDPTAQATIRKLYDPFAFLGDLDANWTSLAIAQLQANTTQFGGHEAYVYQTSQGNLSLQIVVDRDTGFPYLFSGAGFQRGTSVIPTFTIKFEPAPPPS